MISREQKVVLDLGSRLDADFEKASEFARARRAATLDNVGRNRLRRSNKLRLQVGVSDSRKAMRDSAGFEREGVGSFPDAEAVEVLHFTRSTDFA